MNWFLNIAIIAAATAVLFTHSHAAPTAADIDVSILPHPYYQGQVEQDPVPDPGIGDWFANIYNVIVKVIAKGLEDRDPKKIEVLKNYIKRMRKFVSPGANFVRQYVLPR